MDRDALIRGLYPYAAEYGVAEAFRRDLVEAVAYARQPPQPVPKSSGIYGGGGINLGNDPAVIQWFFVQALDAITDGLPPSR